MKAAILGLVLVSVAATPAQAERFAILCKGTQVIGIKPLDGQMVGGSTRATPVTYVVDDETQTIQEFDKEKHVLIEVCTLDVPCERRFSVERVTIRGSEAVEKSQRALSFDWDRRTNKLETGVDLILPNGSRIASRSSLKCAPAKMPVLPA